MASLADWRSTTPLPPSMSHAPRASRPLASWKPAIQLCERCASTPRRAWVRTGCVDLPAWVSYVDSAGYTGPIEVEVFNTEVWARPGEDVLAEAVAGYRAATARSAA